MAISKTLYRIFASYRDRDRAQGSHARRPRGFTTSKRGSIRAARNAAREEMPLGVFPRQVSVYAVPPGQSRGRLIYQCHWSRKHNRLVVEEL
jgi:hypothetical protein